MAEDQRTSGVTSLGHLELVKALGEDKGHIRQSQPTLEARGLSTLVVHPAAQRPLWTSPQRGEMWPRNLHKVVNKV